MKAVTQLIATLVLISAFSTARAQTCQPPAVSQLSATNITLSSARLNCTTVSGASIYQFQYRKTGASGWTATPSSSLNFADITGLLSNTSYQFQCRVYCTNGWTNYSSSKSFTTNAGGNSCSSPFDINCGNNYSGSNNTGNYNYTSYPFPGSTGLTGPEAYHRLTITFPVLVTLNMQPQTGDLDLYLMSTCGNSNGLAVSQNANNNAEQIAINLNPGTYYIIVDGYNNAISNYTLSVSCNQNTSCAAPAIGDLFTTNLTCSSVRLNCDNGGANAWDWAYRPLNTVNWIDLPVTSNAYYDLGGLQASTTYEYKCNRRCSNMVWSDWSPIRQFTTPNCGPSGNNCNNPIIAYCGYTYTGNNGTGSNNFSNYKFNGQSITNESGPEVIYKITIATAGPISITLGGLSADLDLFLLSNCNNNAVIAVSGNSGSLGEVISIGSLPVGTYQIVVDGWDHAISNYSLKITCNGEIPISNDEPCYATEIGSYTNCFLTNTTNVGATSTTNPLPLAGCYTSNMRDVWFKVQLPLSGKMLVSTFPGTLTDAVIAVYAGPYCTGLTNYGGCFDDTNGDRMPDIQIQGTPGSYIYLRIWGYNGAAGSFSLCATTLNAFQLGLPLVIVNNLLGSDERMTTQKEKPEESAEANTSTMRLYPVPAGDVLHLEANLSEASEVQVQIFNLAGQLVQEELPSERAVGAFEITLDVSNLPAGIFLVRLKSGDREITSKIIRL